tara:strand:- start:154 stop:726 length:573 start_codon:yes stop_codon:yes gene_type:complete
MNSLMNVINADLRKILNNRIIKSMSIIDWGKCMARPSELIQTELLSHCGLEINYSNTKNNSPGFDILVKNKAGELKRVQSKLRQVKGKTDFSRQIHFETTRRHSNKNEGASSGRGHVVYSHDEFDYVMVSLINVRDGLGQRNNLDLWSFSIVPINELIDSANGCCLNKIPSNILKKYKYIINPNIPPNFV